MGRGGRIRAPLGVTQVGKGGEVGRKGVDRLGGVWAEEKECSGEAGCGGGRSGLGVCALE